MSDNKFEAMLKKTVNPGKCREALVGNGKISKLVLLLLLLPIQIVGCVLCFCIVCVIVFNLQCFLLHLRHEQINFRILRSFDNIFIVSRISQRRHIHFGGKR